MEKVLQKNMKLYMLNGIFYTIMFNLYSPFAVKFLQRLGGNEFHISLLNALPGLVAVFSSLPGAIYITKCRSKGNKRVIAEFFFASRILLIAFACMPLFPPSIAPLAFVIIFSLKNFPESISQSGFQSFSGDIFPSEIRSTAISLRSKFSVPATLIVTLICGFLLRMLPKTPEERMMIYQVFFILSFIIGIAEIIFFMKLKESKQECGESLDLKESLSKIIKHKDFVRFTKSSLLFYFGWQMGWPLFNIYQVIYLGADELWLSMISIAMAIGMFCGYSFWNRMIKKKGNAIVASITTAGMAINPLLLAISPNLYVVTLLTLIVGFFTSGNVTVLLNYLLEVTPAENRVIYVGVYNTFINMSLAVSPIVGHFIYKATNIHIALIAVFIVRFLGSITFYLHNSSKPVNQREFFIGKGDSL